MQEGTYFWKNRMQKIKQNKKTKQNKTKQNKQTNKQKTQKQKQKQRKKKKKKKRTMKSKENLSTTLFFLQNDEKFLYDFLAFNRRCILVCEPGLPTRPYRLK